MMKKRLLLVTALFCSLAYANRAGSAEQSQFEYPFYLVDAYDADGICWQGMRADGSYLYSVVPERWLVGPPPSEKSAVTVAIDHWIELQFLGRIVDGPGGDIRVVEMGRAGEHALIFMTDGAGREYLLDEAVSSGIGGELPTPIHLETSGVELPFVPRAVRIVALDPNGLAPGFDVASLRARIDSSCSRTACNPIPVDGAKGASADASLHWTPGCAADEHIIYFGTKRSDVEKGVASVSNPPQPLDANSFEPFTLQLGQKYYWRVDEANDVEPNSPWMGEVWSFSVADCCIVDDFESYSDSNNPLSVTWTRTGGRFLYIVDDPVHECSLQSMALEYSYGGNFYTEVVRTFSPPVNWISSEAKMLELFFWGTPGNDTGGQLYVRINDDQTNVTVPYDGDANDVASEAWHAWRIDLQEFADLNLANIESIAVGLRPATGPSDIGMGILHFDNIRLCTSKCLPEKRPHADFNRDCTANFQDLEEMTQQWLDTGYNIYPVAAPNAPAAWYKFDGDTTDSAGDAHGEPDSHSYDTGVYGQAIRLDGHNDSVQVTNAANLFARIDAGITIAFWQFGEDSPHRTDTICCSNYTYGQRNPAIAINLGCWRAPGKYNWDCGHPWSFENRLSGYHRYKSEWTDRWNHWAFTKDVNDGTMQIFLNGGLYDSRVDANSPITGITSFEIGSGWYGGYDGLIDDFRIYDYALSQPEVAHVATDGTGVFDLPLLSPVDLFLDDHIDFHDFAPLASDWLEDHLWP
jgi:hypothetical protein